MCSAVSGLNAVFPQSCCDAPLKSSDIPGPQMNISISTNVCQWMLEEFQHAPCDHLTFHELLLIWACTLELTEYQNLEDSVFHSNLDLVVFLGGACNPTTWRKSIAIPFLEANNICYYNPQVDEWSPELIQLEHDAKETSGLLLYVFENWKTRAVTSLLEVSYLIGQKSPLILVINNLAESGLPVIAGEQISEYEYACLKEALANIINLANRFRIPVFSDLMEALKYVKRYFNQCRSTVRLISSKYGLSEFEERVANRILTIRKVFEFLDSDHSGHITTDQIRQGFRCLGIRLPINDNWLFSLSYLDDDNVSPNTSQHDFKEFYLSYAILMIQKFRHLIPSEIRLWMDQQQATTMNSAKIKTFTVKPYINNDNINHICLHYKSCRSGPCKPKSNVKPNLNTKPYIDRIRHFSSLSESSNLCHKSNLSHPQFLFDYEVNHHSVDNPIGSDHNVGNVVNSITDHVDLYISGINRPYWDLIMKPIFNHFNLLYFLPSVLSTNPLFNNVPIDNALTNLDSHSFDNEDSKHYWAMTHAQTALFIIDTSDYHLIRMIEAAFLIGSRLPVVLCLQHLDEEQEEFSIDCGFSMKELPTLLKSFHSLLDVDQVTNCFRCCSCCPCSCYCCATDCNSGNTSGFVSATTSTKNSPCDELDNTTNPSSNLPHVKRSTYLTPDHSRIMMKCDNPIEFISKQSLRDHNRARSYLLNFAKESNTTYITDNISIAFNYCLTYLSDLSKTHEDHRADPSIDK